MASRRFWPLGVLALVLVPTLGVRKQEFDLDSLDSADDLVADLDVAERRPAALASLNVGSTQGSEHQEAKAAMVSPWRWHRRGKVAGFHRIGQGYCRSSACTTPGCSSPFTGGSGSCLSSEKCSKSCRGNPECAAFSWSNKPLDDHDGCRGKGQPRCVLYLGREVVATKVDESEDHMRVYSCYGRTTEAALSGVPSGGARTSVQAAPSEGTGKDAEFHCCCKHQSCRWNDETELSAQDMQVAANLFNKKAQGTTEACCHNVSSSAWFKCRGGKIQDPNAPKACPAPPAVLSTIDSCALRLTEWFKREDWFKMLPDYKARWWTTIAETKYKAYVPCLVEKASHVKDVSLHQLSFFNSVGWGNPVRTYIKSRDECRTLEELVLMQAVEDSFDALCKFPIPNDAYKPNFSPDRACTFNRTAKTIHFSNATHCPEGHRCACPIFAKRQSLDTTVRSLKMGKSAYSYLNMVGSGGTYIKIISTVVEIGSLATVGIWLTAWKWPIFLGAIGTGLFVFGGNLFTEWFRYSCQAKVGCYPMGCGYVPGEGCRIDLAEDTSDPRNPYWFMPPPMYKCAANTMGSCKLSTCTADDARRQRVGDHHVEYGVFRSKYRSSLFNCQPMLAEDMTHTQIVQLESAVSGVRERETELSRRHSILAKQKMRYCPFLVPTQYQSAALCWDGTSCNVDVVPGPNCCAGRHGGVQQCPAKFPRYCTDNFCDSEANMCEKRGGLFACIADEKCPFLIPQLEDDEVECDDREKYNITDFNETEPWCGAQGGLRSCPWNAPIMCESKSCNGEHCCATDCTELGGQKDCDFIAQFQQATTPAPRGEYSGATGNLMPWHPLGLILALVVLRFVQPRR